MAQRGEKKPGAGRPKGSVTTPQFRNYVSEEERKKFVEFVLDSYMGDMRLAVWFGEQIFGKAPQSIDHTTNGKDLPTPILNALPSDDSPQENKSA